jgi:FkbM family methyltransferase
VDSVNYDPPMLRAVVAGDALAGDPLVVIDVGCGLGIDDAWRLFGDHLRAHGFDPQVAEIERLRAEETAPGIHYHAAFVGLPDEHPQVRRRHARAAEEEYFQQPFHRSSAAAALRSADATFYETNDWTSVELATEHVGLADALRREDVPRVDFVKIDTDGADLDVLVSFEEMIEAAGTLGLMVETPFIGSADDSVNTFHTIDRLVKRHGFLLAAMTVNRYSRAVLPAQFAYSILAQTVSGQPMWGDLVYLRDVVHPDWRRFGDLSPTKLLKLACLYELFELPDCAAELLLTHRDALAELVDVDALLDLLTPPLDGEQVSYRDYVAAFRADPTRFYPPPEPEPEPEPAPTLVQRVKARAARAAATASRTTRNT